MSVLIPADTMRALAELDESAMPSRATVQFRTSAQTPTGGTKPGAWANRNNVPVPCRFVPSGSGRSAVMGEKLQTVAEGALQIALSGIVGQAIDIAADDEINVQTTLPLPAGDYTETARYKVVAKPFVGSYATSLTVPVSKIG